jgi:cephalosporin hydroxylase
MPIESAFEQFAMQRRENILSMMQDVELRKKALEFNAHSARYRYTYNFTALGRPIIQLPQDIVAIQELVWTVRPELIIETGIAHGGSLILSASMLALLDYCDAVDAGT